MPVRRLLTLLGAAALLSAGCSAVDSVTGADPSPTPSSNGVADQQPAEILASARKALAASTSVHIKGNGTEDGDVFAVDMRMKGAQAGRGTMTIQHNPVEVLRIGKDLYLKGDAEFWQEATGDPAAAELLKGKYLKAPTTERDFGDVVALTDPARFGEELLTAKGAVTKAGTRTVAGVETVGVKFTSTAGDTTTLYVATTGKAYPFYVATTGKNAGETTELYFTEYDTPLDIKPPAADLVVDSSKLGG